MKLNFNFEIMAPKHPLPFKAMMSKGGLKTTRQREEVFNIFLDSSGHKSLAQIHALVRKVNPKIGYTTVYRTMKLLTQFGLAAQRKFGDGETRYESTARGEHHDHLICVNCGKIIEFQDQTMESLQNGIAERHQFKIVHHRMELYGLCAQCAPKKGSPRKKVKNPRLQIRP